MLLYRAIPPRAAFFDVLQPAIPLPGHKRERYLRRRQELVSYWDVTARRRRPGNVEGCDAPSRGFGLCRQHYYVEFRR
ncbi:MAG TPA: hypothetical protein VHF24_12900 [Acidimicrobiales bacterium]|nr:hypothetical protein [Acidimicrobiales bacterium]